MTACMAKGCDMSATHRMGMYLWAQGYPRSARTRMELNLNLLVCDHHAREPPHTAKEFLDQGGGELIQRELKRMKRAPIDLTSAEYHMVKL